jgi:hypothetical protein
MWAAALTFEHHVKMFAPHAPLTSNPDNPRILDAGISGISTHLAEKRFHHRTKSGELGIHGRPPFNFL